jgi:hypothetical protein
VADAEELLPLMPAFAGLFIHFEEFFCHEFRFGLAFLADLSLTKRISHNSNSSACNNKTHTQPIFFVESIRN